MSLVVISSHWGQTLQLSRAVRHESRDKSTQGPNTAGTRVQRLHICRAVRNESCFERLYSHTTKTFAVLTLKKTHEDNDPAEHKTSKQFPLDAT